MYSVLFSDESTVGYISNFQHIAVTWNVVVFVVVQYSVLVCSPTQNLSDCHCSRTYPVTFEV